MSDMKKMIALFENEMAGTIRVLVLTTDGVSGPRAREAMLTEFSEAGVKEWVKANLQVDVYTVSTLEHNAGLWCYLDGSPDSEDDDVLCFIRR